MQYVSILRHFPTRLAGLRRVFNTASKMIHIVSAAISADKRTSINFTKA